MRRRPRNVLITGATDGIGLALAHVYCKLGDRLLLIGRRPLAHLDPSVFNADRYCQADLSRPGFERNVVSFLSNREVHGLDLVIHNAGTGHYGPVDSHSEEKHREIIAVNLEAPLVLTHVLLPWLERVGGKVVLIGSVAAYLPCPDYAVYAASKAALTGLARCLRQEIGPEVRVQVVHPGPTRTGLHEKVGLPQEIVDWRRFPPAASIAERIQQAEERERFSATVGWPNRVVTLASTWLAAPLDWILRVERGLRMRRSS